VGEAHEVAGVVVIIRGVAVVAVHGEKGRRRQAEQVEIASARFPPNAWSQIG
jgi:hypothetical protein